MQNLTVSRNLQEWELNFTPAFKTEHCFLINKAVFIVPPTEVILSILVQFWLCSIWCAILLTLQSYTPFPFPFTNNIGFLRRRETTPNSTTLNRRTISLFDVSAINLTSELFFPLQIGSSMNGHYSSSLCGCNASTCFSLGLWMCWTIFLLPHCRSKQARRSEDIQANRWEISNLSIFPPILFYDPQNWLTLLNRQSMNRNIHSSYW